MNSNYTGGGILPRPTNFKMPLFADEGYKRVKTEIGSPIIGKYAVIVPSPSHYKISQLVGREGPRAGFGANP